MTRQLDVKSRHREQIKRLLREHLPGVEVWAYGSRVTGRSHEGSDLDLVLRGPGLVKIDPSQLAEFNEAVQESTIPFLIEARDWARLPESFHREIEQEYVVLVGGEEQRVGGEWQEAKEANGNPLHIPTGIGNVPVEWCWSRLEDVCNGIFDCPHSTPKLSDSGPLMVRTQDILSGVFRTDQAGHVSEETYRERTKRTEPTHGDLFYSREGTYFGIAAEVPQNYQICLGQRMVLLRPNSQAVDFRYLRFWLNSPVMEAHIHGFRDGSVAERLNLPTIRVLPVLLPFLPEQRAIAHILGTLDDKIELNRRMNETLEEMARALFKSWFVDFDPVHAKATLKHHAANQAPRQGDSAQATEAARSGITPPLRGSRQAKGASPQARRRGEIRRLYSPQTLQKAQALRQTRTDAEGLLWHYLRNKQLGGYKFRRQQPIGPYITDFACLSQKLLVELDGSQHAARQDYDEKRDAFLQNQGYQVLRFWNNEVFENCFGVLESIYAVLHHHPPLEGGSKDASLSGRGDPPPHQPAPNGLVAATPPQGGSDWTVERARAYLDGMDADIAALFPDSFEDSELGPIPAGCEVKALDEIAIFQNGLALQKYRPQGTEEWLPVVKIAQLRSGKTDSEEKAAANIRPECIINDGDVVFSWSGSLMVKVWCGGRAALNQHLFKVTSKRFPKWFFLHSVRSHLVDFQTIAAGKATTMGHIKRHHLSDAMCAIPGEELLTATSNLLSALLEKSISMDIQSRTLSALRDMLLPKLISGELRVNNTERPSE